MQEGTIRMSGSVLARVNTNMLIDKFGSSHDALLLESHTRHPILRPGGLHFMLEFG